MPRKTIASLEAELDEMAEALAREEAVSAELRFKLLKAYDRLFSVQEENEMLLRRITEDT